MSEIRDTFFANKAIAALWDVAVSIKRGNRLPLDASAVFESYAALEAYIADEESVAYPGQIIAVVNADSTGIYYLDQNLAINEVGKIPTADNKSIEIADGVITMHDYGTAYYKYVPEEKNEETGEVIKEAGYEKTAIVEGTTPWKAGLEPRVVSENGEFVIGWFEPNPTTVEGVKDQVTAVQGTVNDLSDIINKEGGLVDQVEDLQEEIGHAATETGNAATGLYKELEKKADKDSVYTKEEANSLFDDKANAADVYTKEETKSAIEKAVSAADHLKRKIVANKEAIYTYIEENEDAEQYIFMVPTVYEYTSESNRYDEYIVLKSKNDEDEDTYTIEPVGSWAVDLADYVSETEFAEYLKSYYTSTKVDEILTAYATTAAVEEALGEELKLYYTIEQIGSLLENYYTDDEIDNLLSEVYTKTEINTKLSDIYTKTEADNLLAGKVDAVTGKSLVSDTEIAKLATVKENAEENYIKSVTDRFTVSAAGQLSLNTLKVEDIDGLDQALDNKVEKVIYNVPVFDEDGNPVYEEDGETQKTEPVEGTLLSPEDKEKLAALVIGDEGVQISGKVNADNVEGLASWITNNRDIVGGLFPTTAVAKLNGIEEGAQKNFITTVEETQFTVVNGKLSLAAGITKSLSDLSEASTLHAGKISSLEQALNGYINDAGEQIPGLISDVQAIQTALQWQAITE